MNILAFLKSSSTVLAIFLFAAGCSSGGSASGGATSGNPLTEDPQSPNPPPAPFTPKIETVWSLGTSYSTARISTNEEKILRYGDRASNSSKRRIVNGGAELKPDGANLFGKFHGGNVNTVLGTQNTLHRYSDIGSQDIYMDLVETNDGRIMLEVGGERHISIPTGEVRYSGSSYFSVYGNRSQNRWGKGHGIGNFVMNVNFADGTGEIEGYTGSIEETADSRTLDGSRMNGDVSVSVENGIFKGDKITVTNTNTLQSHSATMHGSFHGDNAKGLTGLYWDSSKDHRFFGSLAGVRNLPARGLDYVRIFADRYNVVQVKTNGKINGKTMLRYGYEKETTPNRRIVLNHIEEGRDSVESTGIGELIRGDVNLGKSDTANSLSLLASEKHGLFFDVITLPGDDTLLEVGGNAYSSIPKGKFTYKGINYFGTWEKRLTNKWGIGDQRGNFQLTADFDSGSGQISGVTAVRPRGVGTDRLDGSALFGKIDISTETGEFRSSQLTVRNTITKESFPAVVNGNFHGAGAQGVTGIYAEQSGSPKFYGLIVGTKQAVDGGS